MIFGPIWLNLRGLDLRGSVWRDSPIASFGATTRPKGAVVSFVIHWLEHYCAEDGE